MRTLGLVLIGGGLALIGYALTMNIAVDGGEGVGLMANNDLMNLRLLYGLIGSTSTICGFICFGIKAISRT